jgi:glycine/D-amino acid oxidase-like deaminating enzyme
MTPDALPIIGREPEVRGLWYATGHGRNGILLAGLTGKLLTQLIEGAQPAPGPLFGIERFREAR